MVDYGATWWGNMWLNALRGIDYNKNRIPRGKRYANNGSVYDVKIHQNQVSAKVRGNYKPYYQVNLTFKSFSDDEIAIIADTVNNSPSILAALLNGELPVELYEKLESSDVSIFPKSWKEMVTRCNCPDYATICKHIAAVIYILTREIDKDPFKVFEYRNCDLLDLLDQINEESDKNVRDIRTLESIIDSSKSTDENLAIERYSIDDALLKYSIDFNKIPDLLDSTFNLLNDDCFFYQDNNFKKIFDMTYRSMGRFSRQELNWKNYYSSLEGVFKRWDNPQRWPKFTINLNNTFEINNIITEIDEVEESIPFAGEIERLNRFKSVSDYDNNNHAENMIYEFLQEASHYGIGVYNYNIQFLNIVRAYLLELVKNKAIIPEIFKIPSGDYRIRWNPANYNKQIKKITQNLAKFCPNDLICFENKTLSKEQQVDLAINIMLKGFIGEFISFGATQKLKRQYTNPVFNLFFIEADKFNESSSKDEDAYLINQWLSNFSLKDRDYRLYLFVDEIGSGFSIDLKVSFDDIEFIDIHDILTIEKYENDSRKLQILADSYLIKNLFPDITKVIDYGKSIEYGLEKFSPFFKYTIPLFETIGLSIILPKNLQEIYNPKIKLKSEVDKSIVKHYISFDDIVKFNWEIAIADTFYSKEEFEKLLEKSGQIVKLKDKYVFIDEKQAKSILKQMDRLPDKLKKNQLLQLLLTSEIKEIPVDIDYQLNDLLTNIKSNEKVPVPKDLNAKLRNYQVRGYRWLIQNIKSGFGSILADDMGLGKTIEVLTTILYLKCENKDLDSILIIAPTALLSNWQNEIRKFTPTLTSYIYHGTGRVLPKRHYDIILTSYGVVRKDEKKLKKYKWNMVVVDEAQNIKNPSTKQTKAVKSIKAPFKIAITGTPIENRLSEYWSIFDFINKQYLGTQKQFRNNYIIPIEVDKNTHVLDNFKKITNPFILRRLKTDKNIIEELPDKITNDIYCSLSTKQIALYKQTIDLSMKAIEGIDESIERKGLILKLINALKQICNHPAQYTQSKKMEVNDSGKTEVLMNILDNILQNNEKVLIFTQYVQMGNILKDLIEKTFNTDVLFLHGGQSRLKKDRMIHDFQNNPMKKIFILSLKAGGTGLNLTAAQNVIHYDLWWNPAVENQATDRAYRIGQVNNVMVYRLITKGTFEEDINQMIMDKRELTDMALDTDEQFITEMNNEELRKIFNLRI